MVLWKNETLKSMGLNLLFSSSNRTSEGLTIIEGPTLPNPDPANYEILRHETAGDYLIAEIRYLDCTNYEGKKVMVFRCTLQDLLKQKLIDPHFSDGTNFISPIARFAPTEQGWNHALIFVKQILK